MRTFFVVALMTSMQGVAYETERDGVANHPPLSEASETSEVKGMLEDGFDSFVDERNKLSERVFLMGRGLDRYLSGDDDPQEFNESYARLRLSRSVRQDMSPSNDSDFKFRVDLPTTKKKYRLIVQNEIDQNSAARSQMPPSELSSANLSREGLAAAIGVAMDNLGQWESAVSTGIRGTIPLDPFAKHTLKRHWDLGNDWGANVRSRISYFNSRGYDYNLTGSFERMLEPDLGFRSVTEGIWEQDEDILRFGQVFAVTRYLSDRKLLDQAVGVVGSGWDHTNIDVYFYAITHRQFLHDDWLILDLVPQIDFARERDFRRSLSFTARIEVLFFKHNPF